MFIIYSLYFSHPTNNVKYCEMQNKLEIKQTSLTRVSETRCNCRFRNCKAVKTNYLAIINVLTEDVEECTNSDHSQTTGKIICTVLYLIFIFILL